MNPWPLGTHQWASYKRRVEEAEREAAGEVMLAYRQRGGKLWEARVPCEELPDLEASWLACSSAMLDQHSPEATKTQLRTCRIGLRPFAKRGKAKAMMARLNERLGITDETRDPDARTNKRLFYKPKTENNAPTTKQEATEDNLY